MPHANFIWPGPYLSRRLGLWERENTEAANRPGGGAQIGEPIGQRSCANAKLYVPILAACAILCGFIGLTQSLAALGFGLWGCILLCWLPLLPFPAWRLATHKREAKINPPHRAVMPDKLPLVTI